MMKLEYVTTEDSAEITQWLLLAFIPVSKDLRFFLNTELNMCMLWNKGNT